MINTYSYWLCDSFRTVCCAIKQIFFSLLVIHLRSFGGAWSKNKKWEMRKKNDYFFQENVVFTLRYYCWKQKFLSFVWTFVLIITCLRGQLRITCPSAFLKISIFSNQSRDYWLIAPNQQTLCIETNIF